MEPVLDRPDVHVASYLGPGDERSLADDVLDGLTRPFKELAPKHLYDARGSELFDAICEQPEYYPTRTERAILQARAEEIVARTGAEKSAALARVRERDPGVPAGRLGDGLDEIACDAAAAPS